MARSKISLFAILAICVVRAASYKVPDAKLEAIWPKGLKVTVPGMLDLSFFFLINGRSFPVCCYLLLCYCEVTVIFC